MTTPSALLERLAPQPAVGVRAERGRAWFDEHGLPDTRQEAWRYTPLDDIVAALDQARPAPEAPATLDAATIDRLVGSHGGPRLVFVNGVLVRELSDLHHDIGGLVLGGADDLRPRRRPDAPAPLDEPADGFHALNWAAGTDVAGVMAETDAAIDVPVHLVHLAAPGDGVSASHPRSVIRLAARSRLRVIETFAGFGGRPITNASTRIVAADESTLSYHRVIAETDEAIHIGRTGISQARGSVVKARTMICGGHIVRNALDVALNGDGARSELEGLYLPIGTERHDNVVTVDHAASHCTSTQRFKGVIDGRGRGSFSGHVIVRHGTIGTDADQSNPNLVLTSTAQADTRPWLEIFADDVRCTHGATVGRLDDEAFFYLRSRGIPAAEARSMLVEAFAAEIVDAVAPESLRDWLRSAIAGRHGGPTA